MTKLVSYDRPAGLEIQCPHCLAINVKLHGGQVKAHVMFVSDERGPHFECKSCSKAWNCCAS